MTVEITNIKFPEKGCFLACSTESKFVLPIPVFDGDVPLKTPEGQDIQYQPPNSRGVVWKNAITGEWQGVRSNGEDVIIINQMTREEAMQVKSWIDECVGQPNKLGAGTIINFVDWAKNTFNKCVYSAEKMKFLTSVEAVGEISPGYGLYQRKAQDVFESVRIKEAVRLTSANHPGPGQLFETGFVLIRRHSDIKAVPRPVLADAFCKTYKRLVEDRKLENIDLEDVPEHKLLEHESKRPRLA